MNFQYEAGVREFDLSYLLVIITLLPFAMVGIIFYRGRTPMFLLMFSFALFWLIFPIFFQFFALLYFGIIFLATISISYALIKGYINSKKVAVMTGIFLWLGGVIFYVYMDVYGQALRSPLPSQPLRPGDLVKGPAFLWDEVGVVVESIGGPGILLLAMISILAVGFFTYQRFRQIHPFSSQKTDTQDLERDIKSSVDRAITELHQGKDAKSTILRCYQQMCLTLEKEGVKNEKFMTPREFEMLAIKKLSVPNNQISSIRKIFELAKYSSHQLGEREKENVLENLKALKEVLK